MPPLRWATPVQFCGDLAAVTHSGFPFNWKKDWIRRQIWDEPRVQQRRFLPFGKGMVSCFWVSAVLCKTFWGSLWKRSNCIATMESFCLVEAKFKHCWSKYTLSISELLLYYFFPSLECILKKQNNNKYISCYLYTILLERWLRKDAKVKKKQTKKTK